MSRTTNKHYALGMLLLAYTCSLVDRTILALLIEPIKSAMALSDTALGFLSGIAFAVFYCALGIPIARWADSGNRATIISIAVGLWSVMTVLCGLAMNFAQLAAARVGVAIGEAGCTPAAHSLITDLFERERLARALSIYMMAGSIATLVGFPIGGWLNDHYGWRVAFIALGVPGLILALLLKWTIRDPRSEPLGASASKSSETTPSFQEVFSRLWAQRSFRHLLAAMALMHFVMNGIFHWLPAFFIRHHGMTTTDLGVWLAIAGLGTGVGVYLGGYLADRFGSCDQRITTRMLATASALLVPTSIGLFFAPSGYAALLLLVLTNLLTYLFMGPAYALLQELSAENMRAVSVAIVLLIVNLIGMGLGPQVVGILSDVVAGQNAGEALRTALLINPLVAAWAALHFWRTERTLLEDLRDFSQHHTAV